MKCSRLRNKSLSERTAISLKEFQKQQKFCVNFLKRGKKKKKHFANLDVNSISDNKKFWQIVKAKTAIKLFKDNYLEVV